MSGEPLQPGDRVVCVVVKPVGREIERHDIAAAREEEFKADGLVLGRWSRVIRDRPDEEREVRARLLASREEFFLSLFADPADPEGDKAVLKQLLALLLERRRVLRPQGPPSDGAMRYRHVASGAEYLVPDEELSPDRVARVRDALESLVA